MVKAEDYLPSQLNGQVVQMMFESIAKSLTADDSMLRQIYSLTIDNATGDNLDFLGQIVGIKRLLVPETIADASGFTFLDNDPRKDEVRGFSSKANTKYGAYFLSRSKVHGALIDDALYRKVIKAYAFLKWNGYTLDSIDSVCKTFFDKYYVLVGDTDKKCGDLLVLAEGDVEPNRFVLDVVFDSWSYAPSIEFQIEQTLPTVWQNKIPDGYHKWGA